MNYDMKKSGSRIRQLRIQKGLTQEEVALLLNIDRSFYGRIESGQKGCSIDIFVRLASFYETSLDYLIVGTEENHLSKMRAAESLKADVSELIDRLTVFASKLQ